MGSTMRQSHLMGLSYGFASGPGVSPIKSQITDISDEESHFQRDNEKINHENETGKKRHSKYGGIGLGSSKDKTSTDTETGSHQIKDISGSRRASKSSHKTQNLHSFFRQESEVINSDELFGPGEPTGQVNQDFREKKFCPIYSENTLGNSGSRPRTVVSVITEAGERDTCKESPSNFPSSVESSQKLRDSVDKIPLYLKQKHNLDPLKIEAEEKDVCRETLSSFDSTVPSRQKPEPCENQGPPYHKLTTNPRSSLSKGRPRSFPSYEDQQRQSEDDRTKSLKVAPYAYPSAKLTQGVETMRLKESVSTALGSYPSSSEQKDVTMSLKSSASSALDSYPSSSLSKPENFRNKGLKNSVSTTISSYPSSNRHRGSQFLPNNMKNSASTPKSSHLNPEDVLTKRFNNRVSSVHSSCPPSTGGQSVKDNASGALCLSPSVHKADGIGRLNRTAPSSTVDIPSSTVDIPSSTVDIPSSTVDMSSSTVDIPSSIQCPVPVFHRVDGMDERRGDTVDGSVTLLGRSMVTRDMTGTVTQTHKQYEESSLPFDKQVTNLSHSVQNAEGKETNLWKETHKSNFHSKYPSSEKLKTYEKPSPDCDKQNTSLRHRLHKARPKSYPCYESKQSQSEDGGPKSLKVTSPTASDEVDGRQKIGMKPTVADALSTPCDAVICLWSGQNVMSGEHPLLSVAGPVIEDLHNFKHQMALDQVVETRGGNLQSERVLHCKYDLVSRYEIANVIIKCMAYAEKKKAAIIVFPLEYFDEVRDNPEMITEALMIAISVTQKIHRYEQHLRSLIICLDTEERKRLCRNEFKNVRNRSFKKRRCMECKEKNAVRLHPKSRGPCTRECAVFCMTCLKQTQQCPQHGPCLTPIGHENSYAILVSGYDRNITNARVFKRETKQMSRLLQSTDHVGLREENVLVINPRRDSREEEMKSRVLEAFHKVKSQVRRSQHSSFYFYFSGHNSTGLVLGGPQDILTPRELKKVFYKLKVDDILSVLDCCYSGGSGLTQRLNTEDYTVSMCSLEGVDSLMYLPRLWNFQQANESPGSQFTRIYQLSSSVASEKSFLRDTKSVFTDALISLVLGDCPLKKPDCKLCADFRRSATRADGIFLNNLHESLHLHVCLMESRQHPELRSNDDSNALFAYFTVN